MLKKAIISSIVLTLKIDRKEKYTVIDYLEEPI